MNQNKISLTSAFLLGALLVSVQTVRAQSLVTNVLQLTGITGTSTVPGHNGQIDISTFSWNVGVPVSANGTSSGGPTFGDIIIYKPVDTTSPTLALDCAQGTVFTMATLSAVETSPSGASYNAYSIALNRVVISGVQSAPSFVPPPGVPASAASTFEIITLHVETSIQWTFTPLTTAGAPGTAVKSTYTLTQ